MAFMEPQGLLRGAGGRVDASDSVWLFGDMAMTQAAPCQDCRTTSGSSAAASGPGWAGGNTADQNGVYGTLGNRGRSQCTWPTAGLDLLGWTLQAISGSLAA